MGTGDKELALRKVHPKTERDEQGEPAPDLSPKDTLTEEAASNNHQQHVTNRQAAGRLHSRQGIEARRDRQDASREGSHSYVGDHGARNQFHVFHSLTARYARKPPEQ